MVLGQVDVPAFSLPAPMPVRGDRLAPGDSGSLRVRLVARKTLFFVHALGGTAAFARCEQARERAAINQRRSVCILLLKVVYGSGRP